MQCITHNPHESLWPFLALLGLFKVVRPFLCNCKKEGSDNIVKKKMKLVIWALALCNLKAQS